MNASLPVLGMVNNGNDLIDLIDSEEAGCVFDYEHQQQFLESARSLATDVSMRQKVGAAGNRFLAKYFSVQAAADQVLELTSS